MAIHARMPSSPPCHKSHRLQQAPDTMGLRHTSKPKITISPNPPCPQIESQRMFPRCWSLFLEYIHFCLNFVPSNLSVLGGSRPLRTQASFQNKGSQWQGISSLEGYDHGVPGTGWQEEGGAPARSALPSMVKCLLCVRQAGPVFLRLCESHPDLQSN